MAEAKQIRVAAAGDLHYRDTRAGALRPLFETMSGQADVAVLHYAPVRDTVQGEPPEIFPYLGTTRLADPIDAFRASVCIHAHAHHGSPDGATSAGIPVHNCSLPLRERLDSSRPFLLLEFA